MKNKVVIKKSDFLKIVNNVYGACNEEYLICLSQALLIVSNHRYHNAINFDDYKGLITYDK